MGRTLYEKIWDAHRILDGEDGQTLLHPLICFLIVP